MLISIRYIRENTYTHVPEIVPEGTEFGFWRIVEHTGVGWFPWPELYYTKRAAGLALSLLKTPKED